MGTTELETGTFESATGKLPPVCLGKVSCCSCHPTTGSSQKNAPLDTAASALLQAGTSQGLSHQTTVFLPPSSQPQTTAQPSSQSTGVTTEPSQVVPCPLLLQLRASPSFLQAAEPKPILAQGCQPPAAPGEDEGTVTATSRGRRTQLLSRLFDPALYHQGRFSQSPPRRNSAVGLPLQEPGSSASCSPAGSPRVLMQSSCSLSRICTNMMLTGKTFFWGGEGGEGWGEKKKRISRHKEDASCKFPHFGSCRKLIWQCWKLQFHRF